MFNFTCFNVEDPDDPKVGLVNGELSIPGNLLRREVFDPVVNQVRYSSYLSQFLAKCFFFSPFTQALELIEAQMKKVNQRIDALLLVGGFSGSGYLFKRVEVSDEFPRGRNILNLISCNPPGTVWGTSESDCTSLGR
jgi:hypothetical protein